MPETSPRPRAAPTRRGCTRRTTLALAPLVAAAGCRWGPAEDREVVTEQEQDADAALVAAAATAIDAQLTRLTVVSRSHPGAAAALTGLTAAHQAHLRLLPAAAASPTPETPGPEASPSAGATTPPPATTSRAALAQVRAEEAALQAQLVTLATSAVSGPLARALASMSASVAQLLAAMPPLPAEGPA